MPTGSRRAWPTSPACVAYALDVGDDTLALRMKLCLHAASALARMITTAAPSTVTTERRELERSLDDVPAAPATCELARDIQNRMRRARDQLMTLPAFPGRVEATSNACERDLRSAMIQRRNTNGCRAMWSAKGEVAVRTVTVRTVAVRTVVVTARIFSDAGTISA